MNRPASKQGFTLPEVVLACAVLTTSILGIYNLQGMVLRMNEMSADMAGAAAAGQAKIEELSALDPAARASGTDTFGGFSRSWTLVTGLSTAASGLTVTTTWTDVGGGARRIVVSTILPE